MENGGGGGNRSIKESIRITTLSFGGKSDSSGAHSLSHELAFYSSKKADFAADGPKVLSEPEGIMGAAIKGRKSGHQRMYRMCIHYIGVIGSRFEFCCFEFRICFGFRVSDFGF